MKYPYRNETGSWIDTMDPVQRGVWDKLNDADVRDWPEGIWEQVGVIVKDWNVGICGDILFEAMACWCHYNVVNGQVSDDLKRFMGDEEELVG